MSPLDCSTASLATPPPTPRSVSTFPPLPNAGSRPPGAAAAAALTELTPMSRPEAIKPPSQYQARFRILFPSRLIHPRSWARGTEGTDARCPREDQRGTENPHAE